MSYKNCVQRAALALCMVQALAISAPGPQATKEITHLLGFIQESPCTFTRNGKAHSGRDAQKHIQDKRDYFVNDIQTAEDFVRLSATQSELSRRAYTVKCPGQAEEPSKDWLLRELKRYRANLVKPAP